MLMSKQQLNVASYPVLIWEWVESQHTCGSVWKPWNHIMWIDRNKWNEWAEPENIWNAHWIGCHLAGDIIWSTNASAQRLFNLHKMALHNICIWCWRRDSGPDAQIQHEPSTRAKVAPFLWCVDTTIVSYALTTHTVFLEFFTVWARLISLWDHILLSSWEFASCLVRSICRCLCWTDRILLKVRMQNASRPLAHCTLKLFGIPWQDLHYSPSWWSLLRASRPPEFD